MPRYLFTSILKGARKFLPSSVPGGPDLVLEAGEPIDLPEEIGEALAANPDSCVVRVVGPRQGYGLAELPVGPAKALVGALETVEEVDAAVEEERAGKSRKSVLDVALANREHILEAAAEAEKDDGEGEPDPDAGP